MKPTQGHSLTGWVFVYGLRLFNIDQRPEASLFMRVYLLLRCRKKYVMSICSVAINEYDSDGCIH